MNIPTKIEQTQNTEIEQIKYKIAQLERELVRFKQSHPETEGATVAQSQQSIGKAQTQTGKVELLTKEPLLLISHEMRNPLTSIKGFAQLLERNLHEQARQSTLTQPTETATEILKEGRNLRAITNILHQVGRMEELIDRLVGVPGSQGSYIKEISSPVSRLYQLGQTIIEQQCLLASSHHAFKVKSSLTQQDLARRMLKYDESEVEQVLNNFLGNAIKYSPTGTTITLGIEIGYQPDQCELILSVRDEGYGISPQAQKHLFEQFYREENIRTAQTDGCGLGLYICWQIITRLEGKIWVESELENGSTFYFSLPLSEG